MANSTDLLAPTARSPVSEKHTFPETPTKQILRSRNSIDSVQDEGKQSTVRGRRGYRPLSVFTRSVFNPFDSETLRAMDLLSDENTNPGKIEDRYSTECRDSNHAQSSPTLIHKREQQARTQCLDGQDRCITQGYQMTRSSLSTSVTPDRRSRPLPVSHLYHNQVRISSTASFVSDVSTNESEISLGEFLKTTSPTTPHIKANFASLFHLPPPDPTQHPAFQPNPFVHQSDSPSLITTSNPDDIRKVTTEVRLSHSSSLETRTSGSSDAMKSAEKRNFFKIVKTPESLRKKGSRFLLDSPLSKKTIAGDVPALPLKSNSSSFIEDSDRKRTVSGGLRKLSDIFRPRSSVDRSSSTGKPPSPNESLCIITPTTERGDMEQYLRRVTASYNFSDYGSLPPHPNTARHWKNRNLKCTTCLDVSCACCGRSCCAYMAAVKGYENHKSNPPGRQKAAERIQQITMVYPFGSEVPTFLQCTSGGRGLGCGKMVCPDCCGQCPIEACSDVQCKKCKADPFAECEWHLAS